jgi:hypothetical protein
MGGADILWFLDWALHGVHLAVIAVNLLGWWHPASRTLHRWFVAVTLTSWVVFAPWYGLGYCFLTDWHWSIKQHLGQSPMHASYVQHVLVEGLGVRLADGVVDAIVALTFAAIVVVTVNQWWRQRNDPAV